MMKMTISKLSNGIEAFRTTKEIKEKVQRLIKEYNDLYPNKSAVYRAGVMRLYDWLIYRGVVNEKQRGNNETSRTTRK
jgi:hypothetical protein